MKNNGFYNNNNNHSHFHADMSTLGPTRQLYHDLSSTSWMELIIFQERAAHPYPRHPALFCKDTTHPWSQDDLGYKTHGDLPRGPGSRS